MAKYKLYMNGELIDALVTDEKIAFQYGSLENTIGLMHFDRPSAELLFTKIYDIDTQSHSACGIISGDKYLFKWED